MEITFQMKTHLLTAKQSKIFVCTILCDLERLEKNVFSARENAFLVHHQNLLTDSTVKFPVGFSLLSGI
jgi:hypothetical protein